MGAGTHVEFAHMRDRQRREPSAQLDIHGRRIHCSLPCTPHSRRTLGGIARRILVNRRLRPRPMQRRKPPLPLAKYGIDSKYSIYSTLGNHGTHARGRVSVELLPPVHSRATRACTQLPTKKQASLRAWLRKATTLSASTHQPLGSLSMARKTNKSGNSDAHQEGQIGAVRTKRPNYASKTADCDTPPPRAAITATRRVKTPNQNSRAPQRPA